jgi:hypothetical protein
VGVFPLLLLLGKSFWQITFLGVTFFDHFNGLKIRVIEGAFH